MAVQPALRQTDYLPRPFDGNIIDRDLCAAHFMSFTDYLEVHGLNAPADAAALENVVGVFRRRLQGQARLWIEGKHFVSIDDLKTQFLNRFSPSQSQFARVNDFQAISFMPGDSAEVHLHKIRKVAARAGYGEQLVRDKFLASLPDECRSAVIMSAPENANLHDLVTRAQRSLDLKHDINAPVKEVTFHADQLDEVSALRKELDELKLSIRNSRPTERAERSNTYRRRDSPARPGKPLCFYCLKPNHKIAECRKRIADLGIEAKSSGRSRSSERSHRSRERDSRQRSGDRYSRRSRESSRDRSDRSNRSNERKQDF